MSRVLDSAMPKARSQHRCADCYRVIEPGETYNRVTAIDMDRPYTWKHCAHCYALWNDVWATDPGIRYYADDELDMHEYLRDIEHPKLALFEAGWSVGGVLVPVSDAKSFPVEPPTPAETIYDEVRAERERAHAKHGDTSMEMQRPDALDRLFILAEEVGEVAELFHSETPGELAQGRPPVWFDALDAIAYAGIVAKQINDARHAGADALEFDWATTIHFPSLRAELIQVAAMATAWADAIPVPSAPGEEAP